MASGGGMTATKLHIAGSMVIEDHLKRCLNKTSGKPLRAVDKKLPRMKHSAFGDFPKDHMPEKRFH